MDDINVTDAEIIIPQDEETGKADVKDEAPEKSTPRTRRQYLREKTSEKEKQQQIKEKESRESGFETRLRDAIATKQIIDAKITGTTKIILSGEETAAVSVVMNIDDRTVSAEIPFSEVYTSDVMDMTTVDLSTEGGRRDYISRMEKMLLKLRGARCRVCITDIVPNTVNPQFKDIICSRRLACAIIRKKQFVDRRCCMIGDVCTADILSVSDHAVVATFNGADFLIQQFNLTYRYISNLRNFYKTGDKLEFKVKDLVISDNGDVKIEPNTKAVELINAAERLSCSTIVRKGSRLGVHVTTTSKRRNVVAVLNCYSEDYHLPVFVEINRRMAIETEPKSGDEIVVTVDSVDREAGIITAYYYRHANEQGVIDSSFVN